MEGSNRPVTSDELFAGVPDLAADLRRLLAQVPAGKVTTYGHLAEALGNPVAARWVGHFMMHHEHNEACACHRVVRSTGQLGNYVAGDTEEKQRRLLAEGIAVRAGTVDLQRYGFRAFRSARPLDRLRRIQEQMARQIRLCARSRMPQLVGGVDLSYASNDVAVAAYALVELATGELVWHTTVAHPVRFPYITSYLAFRELPVLLRLIDTVRGAGRLSPVVLVDGSGVLHPRRAGIASHLGVVARIPTIGVTKTLLCGRVDLENLKPLQGRPVVYQQQIVGVALRSTSGSRRPLFVSPGHRANLAFAECLVRELLRGHRLPEPLYWADRMSREAVRRL